MNFDNFMRMIMQHLNPAAKEIYMFSDARNLDKHCAQLDKWSRLMGIYDNIVIDLKSHPTDHQHNLTIKFKDNDTLALFWETWGDMVKE